MKLEKFKMYTQSIIIKYCCNFIGIEVSVFKVNKERDIKATEICTNNLILKSIPLKISSKNEIAHSANIETKKILGLGTDFAIKSEYSEKFIK